MYLYLNDIIIKVHVFGKRLLLSFSSEKKLVFIIVDNTTPHSMNYRWILLLLELLSLDLY